jgi:hypothetical protein
MFTIPSFFPFISMIEPEEAGGGNEQEDNSEAFVDDGLGVPFEMPGEEHQEPSDSEVAGVNPAWNDVINYIPEEERAKVIPKLQEWDNNFAKVQSDFAPYKPLLEHKVSMEEVSRAFQFAQLVNTNPRAVYDELGQRFGFGQGQQQVNKEDDNTRNSLKCRISFISLSKLLCWTISASRNVQKLKGLKTSFLVLKTNLR